ncbi:hypothetical protein ATY81_09280 [Rhizobium sp. R72]|uniref:hypothetical protein n=1 Tax=unclassified Rhizobium TaxID=2613769 RepID=UPI000B53039A|nr:MULTISPECIES: hypothetical protein [unclassified Rhizobium]OWV86588.1 hypothetical protein ATY79_07095 [Rhizobium sp. R693]OWV95367.1 hypothetical protein ATY81_09280 [Rhizobium sp. R72]OWV95667.1 hypothetical protein ATY80_09280 [Rhizobium sp. R711]
MNWLKSCIFPVVFTCIVLASCSLYTKEQPAPVYDVRSAVVVSPQKIPPAILAGVGDRVNSAINATVRTDVYPRVVLTIRILSVEKGQGIEKSRNVAKVSIDAASVEDGSVIAVSSFEVTSFSNSPTAADEILAEDIAARIRSAFSLSAGRA